MARDPVCGMEVAEGREAEKLDRSGRTFYFCSVGCAKAFARDPGKYTSPSP